MTSKRDDLLIIAHSLLPNLALLYCRRDESCVFPLFSFQMQCLGTFSTDVASQLNFLGEDVLAEIEREGTKMQCGIFYHSYRIE